MPNHVMNIVSFRGDPDMIRKMLEEIKNDEEGLGSIDFNKLIPITSFHRQANCLKK